MVEPTVQYCVLVQGPVVITPSMSAVHELLAVMYGGHLAQQAQCDKNSV